MGFFDDSTTLSVSSVVYPLSGDGEVVDYAKSLVIGHVLYSPPQSMGDTIKSGMLNGPGLRMRSFYKWAESSGYIDAVGASNGVIGEVTSIDYAQLALVIPHSTEQEITVLSASTGSADITYWADEYMLNNYPDEVSEGYSTELDLVTNQMVITTTSGNVHIAPLINYSLTSMYLYVYYLIKEDGEDDLYVTLIYRQSSGNPAYDVFFGSTEGYGTFFPFIPVRVEGRMISEDYRSDLYPFVKKAYRKAMVSGTFDSLVSNLETENPSIGDIDFATIVFGVALNTSEYYGRQYIFDFLDDAFVRSGGTQGSIVVSSISSGLFSSNSIEWTSLSKTATAGKLSPDAKVGDTLFEVSGVSNTLYKKQVTANSYQTINAFGLVHNNKVYQYKYITTKAVDVLSDPETSSFIIPLSTSVFFNSSLRVQNQLGNYASYIVFNCYEETSKKWYETGLLNLTVIIVVVVVSIYAPGTGTAGTGLLGSSASIGAVLGFSGAMALLIGTLANAIASMLLIKVFQSAATAAFGDKLGSIIGTIAGVVAVAYGTAYMNNAPMSEVATNLMNPENLLRMTRSVGLSYASVLNAETSRINADMQSFSTEVEAIQDKIDQYTQDNLLNSDLTVDPSLITNALVGASETEAAFLTRTLLSGDDIVDISLRLLDNYAEVTLSTDLPIS